MYSKSWLIIRSLFVSDNSEPKKLIFFLDFLSFFWCYPKVGSLFVSENFDPKKFSISFFSILCQFFWCILKVGSLFASDNSEPKIFFEFFRKSDVNLNY